MSRKNVKKFDWSEAKGQPGKSSGEKSDGHQGAARKKDSKKPYENRIDSYQVTRTLKSSSKGSASMRDIEKMLRIKAPDQRRQLKQTISSMLERGELLQRGKNLMMSKGSQRSHSERRPGRQSRDSSPRGARSSGQRSAETCTGKLSAHPDGYGFVAWQAEKKISFFPSRR